MATFDIVINEFLQKFSCSFLDTIMKVFTEFGSEVFFIVVALIFYWCMDKKYAFKFVSIFFAGHCCIEVFKGIIARPRPYTYDTVMSIGEKTSGYSFPSGHSHSIANITTQISQKFNKKKWIIVSLCVLTVLVMLSRVFLGQHFLSDTIVGCLIGIGVAVALNKVFDKVDGKEEIVCFIAVPVCLSVALVTYLCGVAEKNFLVVLGAYTAFALGYVIEKRFINFNVNSDKKWKHIIKVAIGVVVMLGAKEGLKLILPNDLFVMEYLRYFVVILSASCLLPLVFKYTKL